MLSEDIIMPFPVNPRIPFPGVMQDHIQRVHGFSQPDYSAVGAKMDIFTVRTTVPILPLGHDDSETFSGLDSAATVVGDDYTQYNLDVLIDTISLRAQPVVMSGVEIVDGYTGDDIPALEEGGLVYALTFAIEHTEAWEDGELLLEALDATGVFVYRAVSATPPNNVALYGGPGTNLSHSITAIGG